MQTDNAYDCHVTVPEKACAMTSVDGVIIKARDFEADLAFEEVRLLVWFARHASAGEMALAYAEAAIGQDGAVMLTAWRRTLRIPSESPFWDDLERLLDKAEGKA